MALTDTVKRLLPKNRFTRSVSVLAGGTILGQAIVILASPLVTRLYTPEDIGVLAVYSGLLGILGVVASMRYQLAIPLPKSDQEAANVVVLSLLVVVGMTVLAVFIILTFGISIVGLLNTSELAPYLWLLPLGLLLMGTYQIFNYWAIRVRAFRTIARTKLTQSVSMVVVQVGAYALGPVALLAGRVSGHAAGVSSLLLLAVRNRWDLFRQVQFSDVAQVAKRYRRFPIYSTWGGAFNTTGREMPPLLFATLFSPAAAGIYMLAHRVLAMPMKLIGGAIADVFFSQASDARHEGRLDRLVARIHDKLAQLAMPPALLLILVGPDLFLWVFGENWGQAGVFAQWLAPYLYFQFIASPLSSITSVLEKQAQGMLFQIILLVTRIVSLSVGAYQQDLQVAIALFGTGSGLCWIGYLICVMRWSGNSWSVLWVATGRAFAWGLILVSPLIATYTVAVSPIVRAFSLGLTGALVATRYIVLLKRAW